MVCFCFSVLNTGRIHSVASRKLTGFCCSIHQGMASNCCHVILYSTSCLVRGYDNCDYFKSIIWRTSCLFYSSNCSRADNWFYPNCTHTRNNKLATNSCRLKKDISPLVSRTNIQNKRTMQQTIKICQTNSLAKRNHAFLREQKHRVPRIHRRRRRRTNVYSREYMQHPTECKLSYKSYCHSDCPTILWKQQIHHQYIFQSSTNRAVKNSSPGNS